MPERIARSIHRHRRDPNPCPRREISFRQEQSEPSPWERTQTILSRTLTNYSERYAPHAETLLEFFTIKTQTPVDQQREELNRFIEKHKESIDILKPAFTKINEIINQRKF